MEIKTYERIKSIINDAMEKLSNLNEKYDICDEYFWDIDNIIEYHERMDRIKAEAFDKIIGLG